MSTTEHTSGHGSLASYTTGFVLSLALSVLAYFLVSRQILTGAALIASIIVLALVQLLVQLTFFLHLGKESNPRWNLVVFLFSLLIVIILVGGSLWIMKNLNYHMTPDQINSFTQHDEMIQK